MMTLETFRLWRSRYSLLPTCLALIILHPLAAQTARTAPAPVVTTAIAAQHLLTWLADGPNVPPLEARTSALEASGFSPAQIAIIVQSANEFSTFNADLGRQAAIIHRDIKSKAMQRFSAIQALKSLDQQRDAQLSTVLERLKDDLGRDAWDQMEVFINNVVKPQVVMGN